MPRSVRAWGAFVLLLCAQPSFVAQESGEDRAHQQGHRHEHRFEDAERWSQHFDAPERADWQRPDDVIAFLGLQGDARVVDLGAGTGFFTIPLARALEAGGSVLAVDIEPDMLAFIEKRVGEEELENVSTLLGRPDDPLLEPDSADVILCVNTWHHIDARQDYARRLARALDEGGRVVIVDFREGELPVGPPPGRKLSPEEVRAEFEAAGFEQLATYDGLEYQYVLSFSPGAADERRER